MSPDEFTLSEQFLPVGDTHELYIQDWGNPDGLTFLFLHGGPGSGCNDNHKLFFDPDKHRVIFFDQRGAGKSRPAGLLDHNTTDDLVEDIEKIAVHYGIDNFVLFGGSWGSTLALAYGLKYPKRVRSMVLRGLFTGSQSEIDFLDKGVFQTFYPEVWESFVERAPKDQQDDPGVYHTDKTLGNDSKQALLSAYAYSEMESSLVALDDRRKPQNIEEFTPEGTMIEVKYLKERCFMPDEYILKNAHKLTMPIWLIQGRYDMVCPPITAYKLSKLLPNNTLIWTIAGHSGNDRANFDATRSVLAGML